jgi:aspartokinase
MMGCGLGSSLVPHRRTGVFVAGAITTLGRGGSDLTATVLGAALEVEEVQVWKDVDGAAPVL